MTLQYFKEDAPKEDYRGTDEEKAVKIFEAKESEEGIKSIPEQHYSQTNNITEQFEKDLTTPEMIGGADDKMDVRSNKALNDMNNWLSNQILVSKQSVEAAKNLLPLLKNGTYSNLTNEVYKLRNETDAKKLENELIIIS